MKTLLLTFLSALLFGFSSCTQPKPQGCILLTFDTYNSEIPLLGYTTIFGGELNRIERQATTSRVEDLYKDFDVQVTTSDSVFNTYQISKRARCLVSSTYLFGAGGIAKYNTLAIGDTTPAIVTVFGFKETLWSPVNTTALGDAIAHEVGHLLGLKHQSRWFLTTKSEEYNSGSPYSAPIMGVSYWSKRSVWWKGINADGEYQDDAAIIAQTWPRKKIIW